MHKKIFLTLFLISLLLAAPVFASKIKWIIRGGTVALGVAGTAIGLEETVNQIGMDISDDVQNTTEDINQRFVLDPDEPLQSEQRTIFVHNVVPIRSFKNDTLLFWISADDYDNLPPLGPARFSVGGPLVEKAGMAQQSLQIAYGGNGTIRFPGLMTIIIKKPDHELSAIGIEGFTVVFEKQVLDTLIQNTLSSETLAREAAQKLGGKTLPTTNPSAPDTQNQPDGTPGQTPSSPITTDKWFIID